MQLTYFAWPGGTSAKWMPRMTPRRDTEQLAWAMLHRVAERVREFTAAEPFVETAPVVPVDLRGESPGPIDAERFHLKLLCRGPVGRMLRILFLAAGP